VGEGVGVGVAASDQQQLLLQGYCTVQYEGRPTRARIEKEWLMVCGVQQDRATSGASATQPGLIKRGDC